MIDDADHGPGEAHPPRSGKHDRADQGHDAGDPETDTPGDATTGPNGAVATMGDPALTAEPHDGDATTGPDGAVATMGTGPSKP